MCLVGVVVRRYIDFLILLILSYILLSYLFFFAAASLLFVHFKKMFFVLVLVPFCNWGEPERAQLTILLSKILLIYMGHMHVIIMNVTCLEFRTS